MFNFTYTNRGFPKAAVVVLVSLIVALSSVLIFALRGPTQVKAATMLSDVVESTMYGNLSRIESLLLAKNYDGAADEMISQTSYTLASNGITVTDDQQLRIRNTFRNLIESLSVQGLVKSNGVGGMSELSRAYVSNAASYAVTFVIGDGAVEMIGTVLGDMVDTSSIENSVKVIKQGYDTLSKNMLNDNGQVWDLGDIDAQLSVLQKATLSNDEKLAEVTKLAMQVDAVETMVSALTNMGMESTGMDSVQKENDAKFAEIEVMLSRLETKFNSISEFDPSDIVSDINDLDERVGDVQSSMASLKIVDYQSSIDSLQQDISQKAGTIASVAENVSSIQSKLNETDQKAGLTEKLSTDLKDLQTKMTSVQTDLTKVVDSQNADFTKWKTSCEKNLGTLENRIQQLAAYDNANDANSKEIGEALSKLEAGVSDVETIVAELDLTDKSLGGELDGVITDLDSLKIQVGDNNLGESVVLLGKELSTVKDQLNACIADVQVNSDSIANTISELSSVQTDLAPEYSSDAVYKKGQCVLGSDGIVYRYTGEDNASGVPDPAVEFSTNRRSDFWTKTQSQDSTTQRILNACTAIRSLENLLNASAYDSGIGYSTGDCVYDPATCKFYVCKEDAAAGTALTVRRYWETAANGQGLSKMLGDFISGLTEALQQADTWYLDVSVSQFKFASRDGKFAAQFAYSGVTRQSDVTVQYGVDLQALNPMVEIYDGGFYIVVDSKPASNVVIPSIHVENPNPLIYKSNSRVITTE